MPNVDSLRWTNVSGLYSVSQKFKNYGLSKTNIDAHMMKNMEWGAVAYLSHSKYGKYGNPAYEGVNKEIYINKYRLNNDVYKGLTGCSAGSPASGASVADNVETTCAYTYEKEGAGTGASTTGTIYGIYDMVGGAWDYVMGNMATSEGAFNVGSSGFATPYPDAKYYDLYTYDGSLNTTHARGKLGDATKETLKTFGSTTGGWYNDYVSFVHSSYSFFRRGGDAGAGIGAGVFYFSSGNGATNDISASRSVLSGIDA